MLAYCLNSQGIPWSQWSWSGRLEALPVGLWLRDSMNSQSSALSYPQTQLIFLSLLYFSGFCTSMNFTLFHNICDWILVSPFSVVPPHHCFMSNIRSWQKFDLSRYFWQSQVICWSCAQRNGSVPRILEQYRIRETLGLQQRELVPRWLGRLIHAFGVFGQKTDSYPGLLLSSTSDHPSTPFPFAADVASHVSPSLSRPSPLPSSTFSPSHVPTLFWYNYTLIYLLYFNIGNTSRTHFLCLGKYK